MPITLTLTQGVLPEGSERQAIAELTDALLAHHGLTGNPVMTPNVTAHLHLLPRGHTFSAGEPVDGAWVETKTPSFALADREVQEAFFAQATEILHRLSEGQLPKARIWTNGVHAVDGTWGLNGRALSNAELAQALGAS
jgi:hypothetical protein